MRTLALFSLVIALAICAITMADEAEVTPLQTIARTTSAFAAEFLKDMISENSDNLICSPLSLQIVLAMAAYGARGDTADEMRRVLRVPEDDQLGQAGYKALIETLKSIENVTVDLANKMYLAENFPIRPAYKAITTNYFLSESQSLNFARAQVAADTINAWCEEKTNHRIKNLIDPAILNEDTRMVLLNAVYFKGEWQTKFNPKDTRDRPFHVDGRTTKNVPTMYIKHRFQLADIPTLDARIIELPYKNDELSMVIILPNEPNGLQKVVANLDRVNVSQLLDGIGSRQVELYLPKFKIESTLPLEQQLQRLGMRSMFGRLANFSGITDVPLTVSNVFQKAFIEVNEEGSEAAAVTGLVFGVTSVGFRPQIPTFDVNRPFLCFIRHPTTDTTLFSAKVSSPSG